MAPTTDRPGGIKGLSDPPVTDGGHGAFRAMEIEGTRVPRKSEEFNQPFGLGLEVRDERFVVHNMHAKRECGLPVRDEAIDLTRAAAAIGQIVGEGMQTLRKIGSSKSRLMS